jgi:hypothetical protein
VCSKLMDGGLFVTDGSQRKRWMNSTSSGAYRQLTKYNFEKSPMPPEELVASTKPFTDSKGRTFTCIGYAGERYGPTLVWRVNKVNKVVVGHALPARLPLLPRKTAGGR